MTSKLVLVFSFLILAACSHPQQPSDRLVIQEYQVSLVARQPVDRVNELSHAVEEFGGTVIMSQAPVPVQADAEGETAQAARLFIQVPLEHLEQALREIRRGSVGAAQVSVTEEDVTDQFNDDQSRLVELQAAEEQLSNSLQAATTTDLVAQIYEQLVKVRHEIDRTRGRLLAISTRAASSTISITLLPPEAAGHLRTPIP
jgi:hypothetical protein